MNPNNHVHSLNVEVRLLEIPWRTPAATYSETPRQHTPRQDAPQRNPSEQSTSQATPPQGRWQKDGVETLLRGNVRRALVASSKTAWQTLGWAPHGGGDSTSSTYCCFEVRNSDLPLGVEPKAVLDRFLNALEVPTPVATLTSADIGAYCMGTASEQDVTAVALVTSGFANALRVGELAAAPREHYIPDTINIACWLDCWLSLEARLEALSIIAQARTLAVLEAKLQSSDGTGVATGTGTDCVTLFTRIPHASNNARTTSGGTAEPLTYAGMHTTVGRVVGKAVREAMTAATARWAQNQVENSHTACTQ